MNVISPEEIEKLQSDPIGKLVVPELDNIAHLECDGAVRVLHYILNKHGVPHYVFQGFMEFGGKVVPVHYWIGFPDGRYMDFKARMWLGSKAPNGIFFPDETDVEYDGSVIEMRVPEFMYRILTSKF
jgi:hypothetical protein